MRIEMNCDSCCIFICYVHAECAIIDQFNKNKLRTRISYLFTIYKQTQTVIRRWRIGRKMKIIDCEKKRVKYHMTRSASHRRYEQTDNPIVVCSSEYLSTWKLDINNKTSLTEILESKIKMIYIIVSVIRRLCKHALSCSAPITIDSLRDGRHRHYAND